MKLKTAIFVVALMAAMLTLPVPEATATPRLDPGVVKTEAFSHIEKAWWYHYYYRPHYYYHHYRYYHHYHYYHRWHHYRHWRHWHRRYWW